MIFTLVILSAHAAQYSVVIGAFTKESNARKFSGYARNLYLQAYYTFSEPRNMFYVTVLKTPKEDEARNWTLYLKNETQFKDAWVFTEALGPEKILSAENITNRHSKPRYGGTINFSAKSDEILNSQNLSENYAGTSESGKTEERSTASWTNTDGISYISNIPNITATKKQIDLTAGKLFTFIVETPEAKTIPAEIMLVNYEKAKKISNFNTGAVVALRGKTKNQSVTVVCDVFGYSLSAQTINLDKLSSMKALKQNAEGVWEVRFKLKPMEENEISVMYNTTFYEDASILEPASQKQLDELLTLMRSHPEYKILIHSHCNKGTKRAIKLPATSNGYFDIDDSFEKTGSDKNLTKERAETIRAYLIGNGIQTKRIAILGWGSLEMLVSPAAPDAQINDRIEIELLANR